MNLDQSQKKLRKSLPISNVHNHSLLLRQCVVQYFESFHFHGLEFHHQLRMDSFHFEKDGTDLKYAMLGHESQLNNFRVELLYILRSLIKLIPVTLVMF